MIAYVNYKGTKLKFDDFLAVRPPPPPPQSTEEQLQAAKQAQTELKPVLDAKAKAQGK